MIVCWFAGSLAHRQRQLGRDPLRPRLLQEADEELRLNFAALQFITQPPAQPQIIAQSLVKRRHATTSGHGRASALSGTRSTRA